MSEVVVRDCKCEHCLAVPPGREHVEQEAGAAAIARRGNIDADRPDELTASNDEAGLIGRPDRAAEVGGQSRREDSRFPYSTPSHDRDD